MKNQICFIFLFVIIISISVLNNISSMPNLFGISEYAIVNTSNTYIYRTASISTNLDNIFCLAEKSWYVKIISDYNYEFYKVSYNGISNGYVLKDNVSIVIGIPKQPYPNSIKIININNKCNLRKYPEYNSEILTVIPANSTNIKFIGKTYGEEIIDFEKDLWFFVNYDSFQGYIYNKYIYSVDTVYPSTEQLSLVDTTTYSTINPINNPTCLIIIGIILTPTLIIIFLMYKGKKIKN